MSLIVAANGRLAADSRRIAAHAKTGPGGFKDDAVRMTLASHPVDFLGSTVVGVAHTGLGKLASHLVNLVMPDISHAAPAPAWKEQLREAFHNEPFKERHGMAEFLRESLDGHCKRFKIVNGTAYVLVLTQATTWEIRYHAGLKNDAKRLVVEDTRDLPVALGQNDRIAVHYMRDHHLAPEQAIDGVAIVSNGQSESPIGGPLYIVDRATPHELRTVNMGAHGDSKRRLIDALTSTVAAYDEAVEASQPPVNAQVSTSPTTAPSTESDRPRKKKRKKNKPSRQAEAAQNASAVAPAAQEGQRDLPGGDPAQQNMEISPPTQEVKSVDLTDQPDQEHGTFELTVEEVERIVQDAPVEWHYGSKESFVAEDRPLVDGSVERSVSLQDVQEASRGQQATSVSTDEAPQLPEADEGTIPRQVVATSDDDSSAEASDSDTQVDQQQV